MKLAWPASFRGSEGRQAYSQRGEKTPVKLIEVLLNNTSGLPIVDQESCSEVPSRCENQGSHCRHSWPIVVSHVPGSVIV